MALSFRNGHPAFLLPALLLLVPVASYGLQTVPMFQTATIEGAYVEWASARRSVAEDIVPSPHASAAPNTSFVLASEGSRRKDPLDGYKHYVGGWNISDHHYWATVAFAALPLFLIGIIWFLGFGLALLLIGCCYCCCQRRSYSYSQTAYALSLICLSFSHVLQSLDALSCTTDRESFTVALQTPWIML